MRHAPRVSELLRAVAIRRYQPADEESWLRCRVLSFLPSDYYDDVLTEKPSYPGGLELVAVAANRVVGIYDVSVDGGDAVLETLAVHPDHERQLGSKHLRSPGDCLAPFPSSCRAVVG